MSHAKPTTKKKPIGSGDRVLVYGLFIIIGYGVLSTIFGADTNRKPIVKANPKNLTKPCDRVAAEKYIALSKEGAIIYKIVTNPKYGSRPEIHVDKNWYGIPVDVKKAVDFSIQCSLTGYIGIFKNVDYLDAASGKRVGTSGERGFDIDY